MQIRFKSNSHWQVQMAIIYYAATKSTRYLIDCANLKIIKYIIERDEEENQKTTAYVFYFFLQNLPQQTETRTERERQKVHLSFGQKSQFLLGNFMDLTCLKVHRKGWLRVIWLAALNYNATQELTITINCKAARCLNERSILFYYLLLFFHLFHIISIGQQTSMALFISRVGLDWA